jgi:hypothetical protein
MPSVGVRGLLFISSFAPLLAALALLDSFGKGVASIVLYAVSALGVAVVVAAALIAQRAARDRLRVDTSTARDADMLSYVVTYLLPFLSLSVHTGRERLAVGLVFGLLAVLYIQAGLFYVNPLLGLFGLRLFEVESGGEKYVLLTRRFRVPPNATLVYRRVSERVLVEAHHSSGSA